MPDDYHRSELNIKCIKCGFDYKMGFSYTSRSKQRKDSRTAKCRKCNQRFYWEYEYGPQKTAILKLDFPNSKFHDMIWHCFECNYKSEENIEWYGKDLEDNMRLKCKECASHTKIVYSVNEELARIISSEKVEVIIAKWNEYYELVPERDECFILTGSDTEIIGDDYNGFIGPLIDDFGIKYEDAGYGGGIGGADRWEEYLPFLDGGYIRKQGNPDNPDISNGLTLEGFWIFGIKAFRMICYIEDLEQPSIVNDEKKIPTYMELSKELRNQSKIIDYEAGKRILLDKLYGTSS